MDKYYQLLDRDPSTISPMWKACHILCFIIVIISGFIAAYALGKAEQYFGSNCILFASMAFVNTSSPVSPAEVVSLRQIPDSSIRSFNMWYTQWGSPPICNYCQFAPLCATIFGVVWCTFFIICSRGGAGYTTDEIYRPWRLVYPAMIYTLISTVTMFGSLIELSAGIKHFCAQFEPVFRTESCTYEIDEYTVLFSSSQKPLIATLKTSLVSTYVCFFTGLAQLCLLLLRIKFMVDFKMIQVAVTNYVKGLTDSGSTSPTISIDKVVSESNAGLLSVPIKLKQQEVSQFTDSIVPIAESESLSDGLSPSPGTNQQKPKSVYFTVVNKTQFDDEFNTKS